MLQAYAKATFSPLVDALQSHAVLDPDDIAAISGLPATYCDKYQRADIAREGEDGTMVRLLLEGWGFRYKDLPDGRRQIIGFVLPGDVCGGFPIAQPLDHSIGALTRVSYLELPARHLRQLVESRAHLAQGLYRHDLMQAAMQRQWLLSIGQRSPVERLAHLFVELYYRLRAIGMVTGDSFHFPLTQNQLAEANGLSPVHVQRTLQDMRRDGLIELADRKLTIADFERLRRIAMFDGRYLQLDS